MKSRTIGSDIGRVTRLADPKALVRVVLDDRQVNEFGRSVKDFRHGLPGSLQSLLPGRVLLPCSGLFLALEQHEHEEPARVLLIPHGRRAQETGPWLFDRIELFIELVDV